MRNFTWVLVALAPTLSILASGCPAHAQAGFVYRGTLMTQTDVLEMMARVPMCEDPRCVRGRGPTRVGPDAAEIADAITIIADGGVTGDVRQDAALLATYAEFESEGRRCARGDWDPIKRVYRSWGAWQERAAWSIACTPQYAASWWVAAAKKSLTLCAKYPMEERLAVMNSGYCSRARGKARHRWDVAMRIAKD